MGENSCGEESRVGVAIRWTTDPGAIPGEPYDYLDIPGKESNPLLSQVVKGDRTKYKELQTMPAMVRGSVCDRPGARSAQP
jgi:hypothetical protein